MRKLLKAIGILILTVLILAALGVGYLTLAEYRPEKTEKVVPSNAAAPKVYGVGEELDIVTWNIGYGALGDNADFFMDGGKMVNTADDARVQANLAGIAGKLSEWDPDIILLQEVDADSARSHGNDERRILLNTLNGRTDTGRATAFANNFKAFVPYPLPPIGKVDSGLYTMTTANIDSAERIALTCPFSWPIRTVNLKRCLLVTRIPLNGTDSELVIVNLHLEAYDGDGEGKRAQARDLANFLRTEANKHNYVIAGGDFNQYFSDADLAAYPVIPGNEWQPQKLNAEEFAGLTLLRDNGNPTCRSLQRPYAGAEGSFQFYMIDGFIVSNNVQVNRVETVQENFVHSDHNPVRMNVTLLPEGITAAQPETFAVQPEAAQTQNAPEPFVEMHSPEDAAPSDGGIL